MQSTARALKRGNAVKYRNSGGGVSVMRRKGTPRQVYRRAVRRNVASEVEATQEKSNPST